MRNTRAKLIGGWSAAVIGLALTALPLYAELFTIEQMSSETTESAFSASTTVRYTMMHVSPWAPFAGGILALIGGFVVGRTRRSDADAPVVEQARE
jgi:hypothetical protein